jgi:NNP family nitrate/nitrite transporter-like MFS transporter
VSLESHRQAPRKGSTRALALATVAFTASFFAWSLLGPLGPDLQDHLGISEFQLAVMVAVPVLLGSVMRVPLGILSDRYGGRRVFSALLFFTPVPLVALAVLHDSFAQVVAFGFLLGFAGASFAVGVPFVNRWYPPERQGAALGIYGMGMIGSVIAGFTGPKIVKAWGLTAPFWIAVAVVTVTAIVFALFAQDAPARAPKGPRPTMLGSLQIFRQSGRAWALTLFYFLSFGGFVAMFLYLPKMLVSVHHLTKPEAGARAAGFALLVVLARPIGGVVADRIGAERVLVVSFAGTALLALGLAVGYKQMVPLTICCLTMGVLLGLGTGAVFKLVPQWFPDQVGAVTGVVGAAGGLGGFFPPLVMGSVKSATGSYTLGFVLLAAVAVICLAVVKLLERRQQPVERVVGQRLLDEWEEDALLEADVVVQADAERVQLVQ